MTKELLQERLKEIEKAIENQNAIVQQHMANLNMLNGGLQEILYWLKRLDEEPALTLEQFKSALGADSVEVIENELR